MENYPAPARPIVARMIADAAASPERAVAFQGAPGANSHIAADEALPGCLPLPCFSFADAIEAVQDGSAGRAIIPIENSLHGRVADMHFLLPESGLVITAEYFLPIRASPRSHRRARRKCTGSISWRRISRMPSTTPRASSRWRARRQRSRVTGRA
jgi:hypothetical protein